MARRKMMSLLTVSVIVAVLLATGPVHVAAMDSMGGDRVAYGDKPSYSGTNGGDRYDRDTYGSDRDYRMDGDRDRMAREYMHKEPRDIYMAVTAGGLTGDTATFSVNSIGMMGKGDMAVVATFSAPLTGTYNTTGDMGYISTANAMPLTLTIDTAGNTSMPIASSSAIIGLHGIKILTREKGYKVAEFSSVSVYSPDGTVKFYRLDRPVKVTHSMDRKMIVIDAYPSFTKRMASAFAGGGATAFVANSQPATIAGLMAADKTATPETIGYEAPAYAEPPR